MRVALLSDIHGNLVGLDAVLADLRSRDIDHIVCLGDLAADGPRPHDVVQRLRDCNAVTVMGNADAFILEPIEPAVTVSTTRPTAPWIIPINRWCQTQLTDADRRYLGTLPKTMDIEFDDSLTLLCYHGSPRSWSDNILATTAREQLEGWLEGMTAGLCAGGHTHEPLLRRLGHRTIINPGSVGAAFDRRYLPGAFRIFPWADYAVIETDGSQATIEFRRVPIDLDALEADARASGMPQVDGWLSMWRA